MPKLLLAVTLSLLHSATVLADNWGHWRGDAGNGVSTTAQPPTEWSATKNVKWKVAIPGRGSSSPVIWGNRVFVTTGISEGGPASGRQAARTAHKFVVLCYDRATGNRLWEKVAVAAAPHEGTHDTNGFASASPCTDGQHVYAHFGSRGLFCYTMDGNLVWKRDFGDMTTRATFGEGSSPTIVDEKVIVPWDHEGQSFLFAVNKLTGDIIWQTPRDEPTCWATPLIVERQRSQANHYERPNQSPSL